MEFILNFPFLGELLSLLSIVLYLIVPELVTISGVRKAFTDLFLEHL